MALAGTILVAAALLALGGCRNAESAPAGADAPARSGVAQLRGAARAGTTTEPGQVPGDHAHHGDAPVSAEPSEHSIYQLPGTWLDQDGREVTLADLAGRVQVVAMVYTHCSYACPRILAQMKRIEGEVAEAADGRVGFTLVSIDPERDRPARLREFAEKSRLDPARWTLLNGSEQELLGLSVLLGVKYRATGRGEFSHSNVITVLDQEGVIVERVEGLSADLEPAIHTIHRLLER